jgi:hypothetical protein
VYAWLRKEEVDRRRRRQGGWDGKMRTYQLINGRGLKVSRTKDQRVLERGCSIVLSRRFVVGILK